MGALFNGIFLVVMAAYVFYMGAMRLMEPVDLPTNVMLVAAVGGILTELVAFWLLYERQKGNLNMKGAFWHVVQTFVGSLIIIVSAVVIAVTGFLEIDPLLGMAFGVVLFWASWSIIGSALRILLQSTPEDLDLDSAMAAIEQIEGVKDVHHLHAWTLTSGRNVFSAHVRIGSLAADGERVLHEASDLLKRDFGVYFSTLQVEDERVAAEVDAAAIDITQAGEATTSTTHAHDA